MTMMEEKQLPEPNPRTHQAHKRETFWQITFPLIVGLILVLTLAVLTVVTATGDGSIDQAADASLVFLIIPLMLVTVLFTIILGALAYGITQVNNKLPPYARQAHDAFERVRYQVQMGSNKVVEPI